jgi:P-type Cu2+ transporter
VIHLAHPEHGNQPLQDGQQPDRRVADDLQVTPVHGHREMAHGSQAHVGHEGGEHAGHDEPMFARPFWISLVLTVPVLVYAELLQELLGYTAPRFPGSDLLVVLLASVIYRYCGWVFLSGAASELRSARPGMMTLVALAITCIAWRSRSSWSRACRSTGSWPPW